MNLYGLHRNPRHWGDSHAFRPERFLLDGKVIQAGKIFFGVQLSNCPGSLASSFFHWQAALPWGVRGKVMQGLDIIMNLHWAFRDTVFLMFSLVLQKFTLEASSQHPLPSLESVGGLTIGPKEYWANLKRVVWNQILCLFMAINTILFQSPFQNWTFWTNLDKV